MLLFTVLIIDSLLCTILRGLCFHAQLASAIVTSSSYLLYCKCDSHKIYWLFITSLLLFWFVINCINTSPFLYRWLLLYCARNWSVTFCHYYEYLVHICWISIFFHSLFRIFYICKEYGLLYTHILDKYYDNFANTKRMKRLID